MDSEKIRKAIDSFEDEDFVQARDILRGEIKKRKNDWLKDKLGLEKNIEVVDDFSDGKGEQ